MRAMTQKEAEHIEAVCEAHRKVIKTMKTDLKYLVNQLKIYEALKYKFGQDYLSDSNKQQLERTLNRAMITDNIGMVIFSEKVKINNHSVTNNSVKKN